MQITASAENLEQENEKLLPAMSPSRFRHRVWEGLVQSSKVTNLGVHRMVSVGNRGEKKKNSTLPISQEFIMVSLEKKCDSIINNHH